MLTPEQASIEIKRALTRIRTEITTVTDSQKQGTQFKQGSKIIFIPDSPIVGKSKTNLF